MAPISKATVKSMHENVYKLLGVGDDGGTAWSVYDGFRSLPLVLLLLFSLCYYMKR